MIWHSSTVEEVLKQLKVNADSGLSNGIADERLTIYGKNTTSTNENLSLYKRMLKQLNNKTVFFLVIIAIVSFVLNLIYDNSNFYFPLLMIAIVVINAFISAYHLYKSDLALNSIKIATNPKATVIRDGIEIQVPSDELVPGDIVILRSGDYITADARIISSEGFRCNEATFTAENIPVEKLADITVEDITPVNERKNMVFAGCSVVHGFAKAVVVETGLNSEYGKNIVIEHQTNSEELPISKNLYYSGKIINVVILVLCILVFLISIIQNFHSDSPFASTTVNAITNAVALGVSAMPESLPAICIIVVALGIQRIIGDNIVIKRIKALELIGKTNVICADKTGILTKNNMVLSCIFDGERFVDVETDTIPEKSAMALRLAAACSTLENDATETAIENACIKYNSMSSTDIGNVFPRLAVIPFDTTRKTMTSINMINGHPVAIVKGAPEILLEKCVNFSMEEALRANNELAERSFRVICIAIKGLNEIPANPNAEEIESNLTFVGLFGISDPPQSDTVEAINACDVAGIRTIMITGDNIITAKAIARRIGILTDDSQAITGAELDSMSDSELMENIENYSVFARISPQDKLRIISAWQGCGKIVTVTGNNIEDADALACADVGCAIGKHGTDVAKGNADVVIVGNKFMSIVKAIKESRGLFENIKKAVSYLLSCNFGEIMAYIIGLLIFGAPPILAVQLLWINLLTDCTSVISLTVENAEFDVMRKKPIALSGHIFDRCSVINIIIESIYIAAISLTSYFIGSSATSVTMFFATLSMIEIFHSLNHKSKKSILKTNFKSNQFMNFSTILTLFISIFLVLTPAGAVFGLSVLTTSQFILCLLLALSVIPFCEVKKMLEKRLL